MKMRTKKKTIEYRKDDHLGDIERITFATGQFSQCWNGGERKSTAAKHAGLTERQLSCHLA